MTPAFRVAVADPLPALAPYFERLVSDAGYDVWRAGDPLPDIVLLNLDPAHTKWALRIEEWLAVPAAVVATASDDAAFTLVDDRALPVAHLRRPFTPPALRDALADAETAVRERAAAELAAAEAEAAAIEAAVAEAANAELAAAEAAIAEAAAIDAAVAEATEADRLAAESAATAAAHGVATAETLADDGLSQAVHGTDPLSISSDMPTVEPRAVSADVLALADDVARAEDAEIRLAEAIADAVPEIVSLDTRAERVAVLRHLIQTN